MTFAPHMPFPSKPGIPQIGGQFIPPSFKQEISVGPYTGGIGDGFGEIGTYKGGATVEPLDFLGGFMDQKLAGSYGQPPGMADYVFESLQRQYGNPKFGNYSIEDKKNVINWYNRMKV